MAKAKSPTASTRGTIKATKKKTSIGSSPLTKHGRPGPHGGNRGYKKRYRGQGK
jgi:hypothetical protein